MMHLLLGISLAAGACATGGDPSRLGSAHSRGASWIEAPAAQSLGAGPGVLHAYVSGAGATLFVARAGSFSGADCALGPTDATRIVDVKIGQRTEVGLDAGEVACVSVANRRGVEVLWHLHASEASVAVASR